MDLYEQLCQIYDEGRVKTREPMKNHTTFRVGGPAAYYVSPSDIRELAATIRLCRGQGEPYYILGNGSDLLVGDGGYDGVMISMTEGFGSCQVVKDGRDAACGREAVDGRDAACGREAVDGRDAADGCEAADGRDAACGCEPMADHEPSAGCVLVRAGAGALLSRIAKTAYEASLTGLEFAAGIPGTLGGAVVMNAGAYGSEMKDVISRVRVLTPEGEEKTLSLEELELGYRASCIQKRGYVVLDADFRLEPGDKGRIGARMEELAEKRRSKQPLEYPSAGSTFKRPAGYYAGQLIDEAGLRGARVGGAQVSEKHCGFIINRDHATAADILELCEQVKERVKEHAGVELTMEVKKIGIF